VQAVSRKFDALQQSDDRISREAAGSPLLSPPRKGGKGATTRARMAARGGVCGKEGGVTA